MVMPHNPGCASPDIFNGSPKKAEELIDIVNASFGFKLPLQPVPGHGPEHQCHDHIRFLFYQKRPRLIKRINEYYAETVAIRKVPVIFALSNSLKELRHQPRQSKKSFRRVQSDPTRSTQTSPNTSFSSNKSFGPAGSIFSDRTGDTTAQTSFNTSFNALSHHETDDLPPHFLKALSSAQQKQRGDGSRQWGPRHSFLAQFTDQDEDEGGDTEEDEPMEDIEHQPPLSPRFMPVTPRASSPVTAEPNPITKQPTPPAFTPQSRTFAGVEKEQELGNIPSSSSKPMEHFKIRDFPTKDLFVKTLPSGLETAPPVVKYEVSRFLANENNGPLSQPFPEIDWHSFDKFWEMASTFFPPGFERSPRSTWFEDPKERVVFTADLKFRPENDIDLYKLVPAPARVERQSCRFFRKFGSKRFLRLIVPSAQKLTGHLQASRQQYTTRLREWLSKPNKQFMGYQWSVFMTRPMKRSRKRKSSSNESDNGNLEVFLFATEGTGLATITLDQLINWFMPMDLNRDLTVCKAYARLELGLSKTYASLVFKPSQVKTVADLLANGADEDTSFNDRSFYWSNLHDAQKPNIMNDGCSLISAAAAKLVWAKLKLDEIVPYNAPVPSAFQARIGPCKGVWMVDTALYAANDDVWIQVTEKNQTKFQKHLEDMDDKRFDPERLTFEVNEWARKPTPSLLSIEFMPILKDRGVPQETICTFVRELLDLEVDEFTRSLEDPVSLYSWLNKSLPLPTGSMTTLRKDGVMPSLLTSRAQLLLECGFNVRQCAYLAKTIQFAAKDYFTRLSTTLRISIPRSTNLIGVADHLGVLAPNEIHVSFSEPLSDDRDGSRFAFLHGVEVLVARHPSLRPSDIQKVRAVCKPELSHLMDVVVFPTTGSYPLAGKLQGGDYDGDRFFLCWEKDLVEPFKNAPIPTNIGTPESYGITVDRTKLGSMSNTQHFLDAGFSFQLHDQLLGRCTNFHETLAYHKNSISDKTVGAIADIHDFLVDTSKNGYIFDNNSWKSFLRSLRDPDAIKPYSAPPYKAALEEGDLLTSKTRVFKKDNLLDDVIFNVTRVEAQKPLETIKSVYRDAKQLDPDVASIFLELLQSPEKKRQRVAEGLKFALDEILKDWHGVVHRARTYDKTPAYDVAIDECRAKLLDLKPRNIFNFSRTWFDRSIDHAPSYWDLVKASALHWKFPGNSNLVFSVAGDIICYLKAHANGVPRYCASGIFSNFKMRTNIQLLNEQVPEAQQRLEDVETTEEDDINNNFAEINSSIRETQYYDAVEELEEMMASSYIAPTHTPSERQQTEDPDWEILGA